METVSTKSFINRESKIQSSHFSYTFIVVTWTWSSYQLYHQHQPFIMVAPLRIPSGKRSSHRWKWKVAEGEILENTERSRMVISTPSWKYILSLIVYTRRKLPLNNKGIIWEYHTRGWIPLWSSVTKFQTIKKGKGL